MQLDPKKTAFLIDGSSFLYRAYYGMRPIHTADGKPVQAVYSFCRTIKKLIDRFKPEQMVLVWDSKGKTERHEIFADYKATRQSAPNDLFEQKEKIIEFASIIGLHQVAQVGIEADDLLSSLTKDLSQAGYQIVLLTSDKDMFQLLNDQVIVFDAFKDEFTTCESYETKLGFAVSQIPFYFSLLGDSSDNIPGVKGIGAKGASDLVKQFKSLDDLYIKIRQVDRAKTRQALIDNKDNAYLSLNLFSLRYHELHLKAQDIMFNVDNWQNARAFFAQLDFKSLLRDLGEDPKNKDIELTEFFADLKNYKFLPIISELDLIALCEKLKTNLFAVDTETTGLDVFNEKMVGISICYEPGLAYYIPIAHQNIENQLSIDAVLYHLKPILEDSKYPKCLHNAKFDQHVFQMIGIKLAGVIFDTMLAASLVTEDWQRIGLKNLSERYLGDYMLSFKDLIKSQKIKNFSEVGLDLAVKYAAADAHQTLLLYYIFKEKLIQENVVDLFYQIELPLVQVLFEMEQAGIYLNKAVLVELGLEVNDKIRQIEEEINSLVELEDNFNLNSPRQIEELLFIKLKLPTQKKSDARTGYSTDQEVLEILAELHPVPNLILKYRELVKLKNTYIDALPDYISNYDNKIHTSFSQISTATGRLASSDPNLQNIPVVGIGSRVRSAFESQDNQLFLSVDYSQIELRVLAYLSQDQVLLEAFQNNIDIHTLTASSLFDVAPFAVSHKMRQMGKKINFSVLYGLTPYGLSKDLKISLNDAKKYIVRFFAQYSGVQKWMDEIVLKATNCGYVTTFWGRKRYVPGLQEKNKNLYDAAKRIAINTMAQGTAAELVKKGMLNLKPILDQYNTKMILQIHDELLISVPKDQIEIVQQQVKLTLEGVTNWNIPLLVTTRVGNNWQEVSK